MTPGTFWLPCQPQASVLIFLRPPRPETIRSTPDVTFLLQSEKHCELPIARHMKRTNIFGATHRTLGDVENGVPTCLPALLRSPIARVSGSGFWLVW